MTDAVLRIVGERRAAESAAPAPMTATICVAEPTGHGDFACRVSAPAILEQDRHIFGADQDHAKSQLRSRNPFEGMSIDIHQEESVS